MVAPNARRLDGTVAEDIKFAHAALDKLSGGNVVGGLVVTLHIDRTPRFQVPLPFTRSAFGVHRTRPRPRTLGVVDATCDAP